jgi:hypothetical protein
LGEGVSRPESGLKRPRIAAVVMVLGLLFTIIGISGIAVVSLPSSVTALLTSETYVKLDGRLFGHVSGSASCSYGDAGFVIYDQHNWDMRNSYPPRDTESIVVSYPIYGNDTQFSAGLPSSEAYYLFVFYTTDTASGYGHVTVEVHWSVWGPSSSYFPAFIVLFWLGAAFVLYGEFYAGLRLTLRRKGV